MQLHTIPEVRGRQPLDVLEYSSQHDPADAIEFIYYLKTAGQIEQVAGRVAEEETTGRWIGTKPPTDTFRRARAEVTRLIKYGPGEGIIHVLSPLCNVNFDEMDPFYQLAMLSVGGPILEFVFYDAVTFIDFHLPPKMLKRFKGPRFGVTGTREFIGLRADEPIIGTIIKPCCGLTPEEVAEKVYQAALGGCVLLKDDEKMMNPPYCALEPKVKAVAAALRRAYDQTGKRVIYCPHINARPDRIVDVARRAIEWGATGIMFNAVLANGPSTITILAEHPDIHVPIYVHSGGRSALSTGPRRIDDTVCAKQTRLLGGDYFQIGVANQPNVHVASRDLSLLKKLAHVFREEDLGGIKATLPIVAGGLGVENLGDNFEAFGLDIGALAGSNVLDHPVGPREGAIAMYQAYEAWRGRKGLKDYAATHPELAAVLKR